VERGRILLDGRPLDLAADGVPSGPASLYFRPHDVEVNSGLRGGIEGTVSALRRHAGSRRVELEVPGGERVEIELPAEEQTIPAGRIAMLPRRYRIFPLSSAAELS
jgi:sulfate transport system ATP-binding protein